MIREIVTFSTCNTPKGKGVLFFQEERDHPMSDNLGLVLLSPPEKRGNRVWVNIKDVTSRQEEEVLVEESIEESIPKMRRTRRKVYTRNVKGRPKKRRKKKKKRPKTDKEKIMDLLEDASPDQLAKFMKAEGISLDDLS